MRYVVAILFALAGAGLAFVFAAPQFADWVVAQQAIDSAEEMENLRQLSISAVNMAGMMLGWTLGWALGGKLREHDG